MFCQNTREHVLSTLAMLLRVRGTATANSDVGNSLALMIDSDANPWHEHEPPCSLHDAGIPDSCLVLAGLRLLLEAELHCLMQQLNMILLTDGLKQCP